MNFISPNVFIDKCTSMIMLIREAAQSKYYLELIYKQLSYLKALAQSLLGAHFYLGKSLLKKLIHSTVYILSYFLFSFQSFCLCGGAARAPPLPEAAPRILEIDCYAMAGCENDKYFQPVRPVRHTQASTDLGVQLQI